MDERKRARYTASFGPIGFNNPDDDAPLAGVSYCVLDNMIHVYVKYSPFEDDEDYQKVATALFYSNLRHNGSAGGCSGEKSRRSEYGGYISIWFPGDIDLEDVVAIVEGVPELKAHWLRKQLNELKADALLAPGDPPAMDLHSNDKEGWFVGAWFSARGGTLTIDKAAPKEATDRLMHLFAEKNARTETVSRQDDNAERYYLRFAWPAEMPDAKASRAAMFKLLEAVPGMMHPLKHDVARAGTPRDGCLLR